MKRRRKRTSPDALAAAPPRARPLQIVTYVRSPAVRRWIDAEHRGHLGTVKHAATVAEAVGSIAAGDRSLRSVLLVDVDDVQESQLHELELLVAPGWDGVLIALGRVSPRLRRRLRVALTLERPLGSEALRTLIS